MSRILRRPLFRGGPVSSYGTGIADGLGTPRVGLDKGGTWWDRFQNWTSRNVPAGEGITGAEVVNGAISAPIRYPGSPEGSSYASGTGWIKSQDSSKEATLWIYEHLSKIYQKVCFFILALIYFLVNLSMNCRSQRIDSIIN